MKRYLKSDIVKEYIKRFPNVPSHTLARKVYIENVTVFKDVEDARSVIRWNRGLSGRGSRTESSQKKGRKLVKPFSLDKNPFKLPRSDAKKLGMFNVPSQYDNILVLSDIHIPFHDVKALTVAIKYGKEKKVNAIIINGDLLDFYTISRFDKMMRSRSVREEIEMAKSFLDVLNREFPSAPIFYNLGNHCIRLQAYLAVKAPELLDVSEFRLEYLLEAQKHNMIVIPDTTLMKVNRLAVTHGHLLIKGVFAPVNSARGAFLKAKSHVLISHVHKVSTHSETTITNKTITCYSTGCLCELNPAYNPFGNNYSHGFAHIRVENGMFKVRNIQIVNGEIVH